MQKFRTNEYNSLNTFNYIITTAVCILTFSFLTVTLFVFSSIPIYVIYTFLRILPALLIICGFLIVKFLFFDIKKKTNKKNTLAQKIYTFANILLYFLLILIAFLFMSYQSDKHIFKNPKSYRSAIKSIKQKDRIFHFPKTIPADAKKIQMYCYTSDYGGEIFILKFYINKEYIEQELKNYKFLNSDTQLGTPQKIYHIYNDNNRISADNTTWYIIDNKINRFMYPKYLPNYSSIGVSNNLDFIIYYYVTPND